MRKVLKAVSVVLAGACLFTTTIAQAQEFSLRVEPGVAIPLTNPQADRFDVGGALAVKPEIGIGSYFSVGPSFSLIGLPSDVSGVDAGTILGFGGFGRVKRPHDEKNTGKGFSAISPWADADLQLIHTGPLNRFGMAAAVGASVPTSDERDLWIGPFIRYQDINQNDKPGFNSNSAKILILGVSFELGSKVSKKEEIVEREPIDQSEPAKVPVLEQEHTPTPPPVTENKEVKVRPSVYFAWDSAVIDSKENKSLSEVAKTLVASNSLKSVRVEGHASSEGQVKHNDALAQKRADAVAAFLVANGVPAEKVSSVGFGSTVPVADNKTEAGRVLNRRVEFVVTLVVVKE